MNCQWNAKIHALYDGELAEARRAEAELHAASCAECAGELRRLRRMGRLFSAAGVPALDEVAFARINRRVAADRNGSRVLRLAAWRTAAAALIMVACGSALLMHQDQPRTAAAPSWTQYPVAPDGDLSAVETDDPFSLAVSGVREYVRD